MARRNIEITNSAYNDYAEFLKVQQSGDKAAMLKLHKKLAKKADRRLRSLEGAAYWEKFKGIKSYAYRVAMDGITCKNEFDLEFSIVADIDQNGRFKRLSEKGRYVK